MNSKSEQKLGFGTFASVYRGFLGSRPVAIKLITPKIPYELFQNEVAIHSRLKHSNIVEYLGSSQDPYQLFLEFMPEGDLFGMMLRADQNPISTDIQYSIILDIARGLEYLHDLHIIHRDLKPENILLARVEGRLVAKIADFGMAADLDAESNFSVLVGTLDCLAPELFAAVGSSYYPYSRSTDIYALSIIMWMLITRRNLFTDLPKIFISHRVCNGEREKIPDGLYINYRRLIKSCWAQLPEKRPQIQEVIQRLSEIQTSVTPQPYQMTDKYDQLFERLEEIESYGNTLCAHHRVHAGENAIRLAQELREAIDAWLDGKSTQLETSKKLSKIIQNNRKIMGEDRLCADYLIHFMLACTGIGLIIMCINKMHSGQLFFNKTTRQKKLDAVIDEVDTQELLNFGS